MLVFAKARILFSLQLGGKKGFDFDFTSSKLTQHPFCIPGASPPTGSSPPLGLLELLWITSSFCQTLCATKTFVPLVK